MKLFCRATSIVLITLTLTAASAEREEIRREETGVRVLIIGIDGACWKVIDPLIARGDLPNLKKLIEGGVRARMKSIRPLYSPAIWTTMATGKPPEQHGIKDFHATRNNLKAKRIWDVISESGQTVGVFGWLITWPPDKVNGFIVPSWLAHGPETHPTELSFITAWGREGKGLDLEKAGRHGLTADSKRVYLKFCKSYPEMSPDEEPFLYRMMELPVKTDLFLNLYQTYKPLFAAYVTTAVDHVSHLYWKFYQPEPFADVSKKDIERYGHCIPDIYRQADKMVGRLLAARDKNTAVFIVSDHGFRPSPGRVNREIKVESLLEILGWDDATYVKLGARAFLDVSRGSIGREKAASILGSIKMAKLGKPLFEVSSAKGSKDLVVEIRREVRLSKASIDSEAVEIGKKTYPLGEIVESLPLWSGTHALYGVLIMNGAPFRQGVELKKASVLDIAPTVMATLGYPVASDMAGRVLREALRPEFLKAFPLRTVETYGTAPPVPAPAPEKEGLPEDVEKKLKSLGYL